MFYYAMCPDCRSRQDWYFEAEDAQTRNVWAAQHTESHGHRALTFGSATTSFNPRTGKERTHAGIA